MVRVLIGTFAALALWAGVGVAPAAADFGYRTTIGFTGTGPGQFKDPEGVAVDPRNGTLYVADEDNTRIEAFAPDGTFLRQWAVTGGSDVQQQQQQQQGSPKGIAIDSQGNVYVSEDDVNFGVEKFAPDGTLLKQWGPPGTGKGEFGPPGPPPTGDATGIAIDSSDNVYVTDHEQHRVQKFTSSGAFISMWGRAVNQTTGGDVCTQASGDTCQAGTTGSGPGQFDSPRGISVDNSGNLYVTDEGNERIQKFTTGGTFVTAWTTAQPARGVAFDFFTGDVYALLVGDETRVERFSADGTALKSQFGGQCPVPPSGDPNNPNEPDDATACADNTLFNVPTGIATDCRGNVYIADAENDRIQIWGESTALRPPCGVGAAGIGGGGSHGGNGGHGPIVDGTGGRGGNAGPCGGGGGAAGGLAAGAGGAGGGGCFGVQGVQSLASGAVTAFAGVATDGSTIRADALADMGASSKAHPGRKAPATRLQLIGTTLMRGLRIGRYKVTVRLSSKVRKRLKRMHKPEITLRLTMTAPSGKPLIVTRTVMLKR